MSEAHEAIGAALESWVGGLPFQGEGGPGILGDWLAVVAMVDVDSSGQPRGQYYLAMRDGNMLPHVALGILQVAQDLVDGQTETEGRDAAD